MSHSLAMSFPARVCVMVLACTLVFSFGLHSVDIHHAHPAEHTHTHHQTSDQTGRIVLSEYAHMGDKKIFIAVVSAFMFSCVVSVVQSALQRLCAALSRRTRTWLRDSRQQEIVKWEQEFFAGGILHPKLYYIVTG